ncbi:hypothetical protein TWF718_007868 [Orbilia javanica]|uniref:Odorant receptor n=1 Tax=Orbilia javanica TaxID=47235 RepID=A0AAN8N066_9PEZI
MFRKFILITALASIGSGVAFSTDITATAAGTTIGTATPSSDIATSPVLPDQSNALTRATIFTTFVLLQFCLLTQPRGSLVYIGRPVWLWRMNPVLCIYETIFIVYFLLYGRKNPKILAWRGCREMAVALLYVRGLPLDEDIAKAKEQADIQARPNFTWSIRGIPRILLWPLTKIRNQHERGDAIEYLTLNRFRGLCKYQEDDNIPDIIPSKAATSNEFKILMLGVGPMILVIVKILAIRGAPLFTALSIIYILSWFSVLLLLLLKSRVSYDTLNRNQGICETEDLESLPLRMEEEGATALQATNIETDHSQPPQTEARINREHKATRQSVSSAQLETIKFYLRRIVTFHYNIGMEISLVHAVHMIWMPGPDQNILKRKAFTIALLNYPGLCSLHLASFYFRDM